MTAMRKLILFALLAAVSVGCQPRILSLNVTPPNSGAGPANVNVSWHISVGDGELSADQPVVPPLDPPKKVYSQGSMSFQICKTTSFKLELPYGGEQTVKAFVSQPCSCGPTTITLTGNCASSNQPPSYITQNVSAGSVAGTLQDLQSDADFPVHVLHAGADIALNAGGGPIFPLPVVPAAGDYTIVVPGQVGLNVCAGASGAVGGGSAEAPTVHLQIVPMCPKP
jgi:hypothetical protein